MPESQLLTFFGEPILLISKHPAMEKLFPFQLSACSRLLLNLQNLVFILSCIVFLLTAEAIQAQLNVKATGTGNTTGHIANLLVTNSTPTPVFINDQTAYIPSQGEYQPYVARIP